MREERRDGVSELGIYSEGIGGAVGKVVRSNALVEDLEGVYFSKVC